MGDIGYIHKKPTTYNVTNDKNWWEVANNNYCWGALPSDALALLHNGTGKNNEWSESQGDSAIMTLGGASTIIPKNCETLYLGFHQVASGDFEIGWDNITLTFYFQSGVSFSTANGSYGSISPSATSYSIIGTNDDKTITATPNSGYHFTGWTYNGGTSRIDNVGLAGGAFVFNGSNIINGKTYTANFAPNEITVNYHKNLQGDDSVTTEVFTYNSKKAFLNLPKTDDGKTFVGWSTSRSGTVVHAYDTSFEVGADKIGDTSILPAENHGATVHLYAVWVDSDFGSLSGKPKDSTWGSQGNPFVISTSQHLKNLSDIVNGNRKPVNSVTGEYYGQSISTNATSVNGVITFANCYFVIASDIGTATGNIDFVPIGKNGTYYFAGTIFGGNDSDANNRTMRTINLNIQQSGVSNVGLFGYVKGATISHLTTAGTIVGGNATGGLVGCMENGEVFNCANSATVTGRGQVGGIVGYNLPSQRGKIYGTIINNGAINGTNMVGGLVGQWHGEWNLNGTYGTFTNTGNVNGGTGASVGGIAGFADRTIKNAANSGNVVGGTSVGGIAGRCQAPIENSYNTGDVRGTATTSQGEITGSPTGVFVGGITGYTSANASISNCYNTGHISALSTSGGYLSNANYVGGIVGFAQAAVSYCANIGGLIEGNDYLGGIVGNSSSTIDHCYDVQGQRKHRYDTGRIGAISGYGGTATNSWAINAKANDGSTCSNPNPTISNVGKVFVSVGDVAPAVIDGYTEKVWTDILTININGFKATATVNNGKFLASATASNGATSVVPAKIDGALTANANGASAQQTTDATLTYWYNANTSSNIYVQIKILTVLPT